MKVLPLFTICLLLLSSLPALAGDKVNNGGGIWNCPTADGHIKNAMLVDFYEAQNQYNLSLVVSARPDPMDIVADVEATLPMRFPDYAAGWSAILADVKTRIQFVNMQLEKIPDVFNIGEPLPFTCPLPWEYVQFANYNTTKNLVYIREDVWQSPNLAALDKAGLIWHEVIYRWMREQFADADSVRSRNIVGLLFSTESPADARKLLAEILKPSPVNPTPTTPEWLCLVKNNINMQYYLEYGNNQIAALSEAVKSCQTANPQWPYQCNKDEAQCGSFTSAQQTFTCVITNFISQAMFTETGRSAFEAEAKARQACGASSHPEQCSSEVQCQ